MGVWATLRTRLRTGLWPRGTFGMTSLTLLGRSTVSGMSLGGSLRLSATVLFHNTTFLVSF